MSTLGLASGCQPDWRPVHCLSTCAPALAQSQLGRTPARRPNTPFPPPSCPAPCLHDIQMRTSDGEKRQLDFSCALRAPPSYFHRRAVTLVIPTPQQRRRLAPMSHSKRRFCFTCGIASSPLARRRPLPPLVLLLARQHALETRAGANANQTVCVHILKTIRATLLPPPLPVCRHEVMGGPITSRVMSCPATKCFVHSRFPNLSDGICWARLRCFCARIWQVSCLSHIAANFLNGGKEARRWGTAHESIVPYQVRCPPSFHLFLGTIFANQLVPCMLMFQGFKTKDGHLVVAAGNNQQFVKVCQVR